MAQLTASSLAPAANVENKVTIEQCVLDTNVGKPVLSCHRCLINTVDEKMSYTEIQIRTLITRCL